MYAEVIGRIEAVMYRVMVKAVTRAIAAMGVVAMLSAPSLAFQESTVGGSTAGPPAGRPGAVPGLDLTLPDPGAGRPAGTEIRIPGVGTLGVLPKLDFGLELLYGADQPPGTRPDEKSDPGGVQLRATIKHRF
jgi:hypothetical protein